MIQCDRRYREAGGLNSCKGCEGRINSYKGYKVRLNGYKGYEICTCIQEP